MEIITFTGSLGKDATTRQAGDNTVTSFSVAVNSGYGDRKTTRWYNCSMWGQRGQKLEQYLTKGSKVAVVGEFSTREWEGKTQLECRVSELDLMGGGQREERQASGGGRSRQPAPAFDDDLSDEIPF